MCKPSLASIISAAPKHKDCGFGAGARSDATLPVKTTAQMTGLVFVLLGCAFLTANCIYGLSGRAAWSFGDFKCVYSGARCMFLGCNPYNESELIKTYVAAGGDPSQWFETRKYNANYLPPALFLATPFAAFPWHTARSLWTILILGSFVVAAILVWDLARPFAPIVSGALIGVFVAGSSMLLRTANPAGIAIGLCVIAVWCFLRNKFAGIGIVCFAISLALKPHDSWLIWLWLFIENSHYRRRAVQILCTLVILSLPVALWFSLTPASSHWVRDLHANLLGNASHGQADDPGPANHWAFSLTNMQAAIGVIRDDPHVYNPATYLISGGILLVWVTATLKAAPSRTKEFLALASISALSLLPLYHRQYDTRLLLMIFPATAMMWEGGGPLAWSALLLASSGIAFTSAKALATLNQLHTQSIGLYGEIQTILAHRPIPVVTLTICVFYVSCYYKRTKLKEEVELSEHSGTRPSLYEGTPLPGLRT